VEGSTPDKGCKHAPRCLDCPFDTCLYEKLGGASRFFKSQRNEEIVKLHTVGKSTAEIAAQLQISRRTVQSIVYISFKSRLNLKGQLV
jgi:DNA-binding CsgD family transcriptional regulator